MTELAIRIKHSRGQIQDIQLETRGFTGEACLTATGAIVARNEAAAVEMTGEFYEEETEVGLDQQ